MSFELFNDYFQNFKWYNAKKVFISGPMTGYENYNREAFFKAAEEIKAAGDIPLNPAFLPDGLRDYEYMDISCSILKHADKILLLPNWEKSEGARLELAEALKINLEIVLAPLEGQ